MPPVSSRSQAVIAPDVAIPPARLRVPGTAPSVLHMAGVARRSRVVLMRNIVVPYMIMRSPGFCAVWSQPLSRSHKGSEQLWNPPTSHEAAPTALIRRGESCRRAKVLPFRVDTRQSPGGCLP